MEAQLDQILRCRQWFERMGSLGDWIGPRAEQPLTFEEYYERYPQETWVPRQWGPKGKGPQGMLIEVDEPGFTGSTLAEWIEYLECMKAKYTALWLAYTEMRDRNEDRT